MDDLIRELHPQDDPTLLHFTEQTGFFRDWEVEALKEVLNDFHASNREYGHRAAVYVQEKQAIGFVYSAPAEMTDRSWYLYWLVIAQEYQGRGIGTKLLQWAEEDAKRLDSRMMFIETSSQPLYLPTRNFYLGRGYSQCAVLPEFYAPGDDMVVFCKRMS